MGCVRAEGDAWVPLTGAERRELAERISARTSRLFGKGPTRCSVNVVGDAVTVKCVGFQTPVEAILVRAGDTEFVTELRRRILKATMPDWQADLAHFGLEIVGANCHTDIERNVRLITFRVKGRES